jgi:hypothetical protein
MVVGAGLTALPLQRAATSLAVAYGAFYGAIEATVRLRRKLSPPGSNWQVPSRWVINASRPRRIIVWGSLLGPGFFTRNAYAGFALLPLIVASMGSVPVGIALGGAIGLTHGTSRAIALVRDARLATTADYLQITVKGMRWRMIDGLVLLLIAGMGVSAAIHVWH